jgi:putative ABC transport system ATP-binding protein
MQEDPQKQDEKAGELLIELKKLRKQYKMGSTTVWALRGIDLTIKRSEFVAVMGPSGSGKSTLMNILGCLDRPTDGSYILDHVPVNRMSPTELADVRNQKLGFIFQSFNLLTWMSAQENVELPMVYLGLSKEERAQRAQRALKLVGLGSRLKHKPSELSGGQQQRVAIARSLVTSPTIILADEPTGNLDSQTSLEIMAILQQLNELGMTVILVTHEADIASYCSRKVVFRDGHILDDALNPDPLNAQEQLSLTSQRTKERS